jgi:hypothetical protein
MATLVIECDQCPGGFTVNNIHTCAREGCPHRKPKHDPVNYPAHYRVGDVYETIRVIEAWRLAFNLGNCIKYISRAGHKDRDANIQDLEKARWYLTREIDNLRKATKSDDMGHSQGQKSGV